MEQQTETLIQVFHALDANGDGHLSREEFRRACGTDDDRLDNIFDIIDADSNGEIDLQEFLVNVYRHVDRSAVHHQTHK
jgi:Ca2+-binding EF-hand superfamily protein